MAAKKSAKRAAKPASKSAAKPASKSSLKTGLKTALKSVFKSAASKQKTTSHKKPAKPAAKAAAGKTTAKAAKPAAAKGKVAAPQKLEKGKAAAKAVVAAAPAKEVIKGKKGAAPAAKGKEGQPLSKTEAKRKALELQFRKETESENNNICREVACELISTSGRYCRLHYIKNWKKIKRKELILKEKKLDSYIEELVLKYPEKYIEAIRQDLSSEKDFAKVISELEIEEFTPEEFEAEAEAVVEDIIDTAGPKRTDFDDEDEFGF